MSFVRVPAKRIFVQYIDRITGPSARTTNEYDLSIVAATATRVTSIIRPATSIVARLVGIETAFTEQIG